MHIQTNRRQHQRVRAETAQILLGTPYTPIDLSESGMQLFCADPQDVGENLPLTLQLRNARLSLYARIVWCRRIASIFEQGYRLGVQFSDCTVSQQLLVKKYIKAKVSQGIGLDLPRADSA